MADGIEVSVTSVFTRLATPSDIPQINDLIYKLAEFEQLADECFATVEKLKANLFNLPPMQGPTVLMLEVGEVGAGNGAAAGEEETVEHLPAPATVEDAEKTKFTSALAPSRTVVGFALFFPNFSTFLAKPGIYLEDLCIREPYRRLGLGTKLLTRLAQLAVKTGAGRVEWAVLDWNVKAISFYEEKIGATVMKEWRICRLTGENLAKLGKATS